MLKFDDELAAKRLIEEEPWQSYEEALRLVKAKHKWDERLQTAFDTWINGGIPEFEYQGITLEYLKEIKNCKDYLEPMSSMSLILEDPDRWIPHFSNRSNFSRVY